MIKNKFLALILGYYSRVDNNGASTVLVHRD